MKLLQISAFLLLSSILTTGHAQPVIPFNDKKWVIEAQGQIMEGYQGKNSLYLQNGMAYLKDANFRNGIIEFDIYLSKQTSFSGLVFRMADPQNFEELYLRAQQSGYPDAYQYSPVYNGISGWQLYHDQFDPLNNGFVSWVRRGSGMGYNSVLTYAFDRWMHVKLLVKERAAELYLDRQEVPAAFMRELKMEPRGGGIGVRSNVGPAHFADFSYTVTDDIVFKTREQDVKVATPRGTILKWDVSGIFGEGQLKNTERLDTQWLGRQQWTVLDAEASGIVNLARVATVKDSVNTVLAKFTVNADKDQVRRFDFGYSDRVRVYCNGNILYAGNASFRTRDFRFLGTIGYFDAVYLPLKKGENTVIFAVSETFGGWGVMGKWGDER